MNKVNECTEYNSSGWFTKKKTRKKETAIEIYRKKRDGNSSGMIRSLHKEYG